MATDQHIKDTDLIIYYEQPTTYIYIYKYKYNLLA